MRESSSDKGIRMAGFDQNRFEALVLYIAHRRRDDERFGRTKLAKVLFYSDFAIYQDQGEPLTGATYIRMPFGPFPKALEETEQVLEAKGLAVLAHDGEDEYEEKRIIPTKSAPDLRGLFEEWQILVVNDWIDRVGAASAAQISEMSHHHPGWLLAKNNGDTIPYGTAILPQSRPTALETSRAKEVARGRGWQSGDGEWLWERSPN
ncbi:MAG TPA: Panacea domain-containing protein [Solirubrobacterales bacterium]|nr:Panacea domain-containing protein [Solirubrobacterales bacterium]